MGTTAGNWTRLALCPQRGSFDLPSVITGVVAVAVLTGGVLVTVAALIPASQDDTARDNLGLVTTAQKVAYIKDHRYLDTAALTSAGYLSAGPELQSATGMDGNCYVGLSESETGRFFYVTGVDAEALPLTDYADPGCITAPQVEELIGPPPPVPVEPTPPPPPGYDDPDPEGKNRYAFCHIGSTATANVNGIMNGHDGHPSDIIPPIPAHGFEGLNWTVVNADTFYNSCEQRESTFEGVP
ncbi:hypothetical protein [Arthrobacter sp. H14]|uniref:hypothetical protein n=1 Tax=Arthrobacter sp. H14 TaxID=1312959 RepID=UPI00047B7711|nr:hypothetical protein [Arthrobacter sp. H14]